MVEQRLLLHLQLLLEMAEGPFMKVPTILPPLPSSHETLLLSPLDILSPRTNPSRRRLRQEPTMLVDRVNNLSHNNNNKELLFQPTPIIFPP